METLQKQLLILILGEPTVLMLAALRHLSCLGIYCHESVPSFCSSARLDCFCHSLFQEIS